MPGKNLYSTTYDLDGRKKYERDSDSGEMRENPWHKYCKEYATKNSVSYAAAISLAGPSWRQHKEKHGLEFRDRRKREVEPISMEESIVEAKAKKPRAPRKPKETFRKADKREREENYSDFDRGEHREETLDEELVRLRHQEAKRRRMMTTEDDHYVKPSQNKKRTYAPYPREPPIQSREREYSDDE